MKTGIINTAIKGFNREWAAITSIRTIPNKIVIGYKLQTACGVERKFPNEHWDDPYGAAMQAMENHRCKHPELKIPLQPPIKGRTAQHAN